MSTLLTPGATLAAIRHQGPLVHNITNFVAMDLAANALLAAGASPLMAHAREEVAEVVALAAALTVNMGTFSPAWIEAAELAAGTARTLGKPWVLDPVGVGATAFRRDNGRRLVALAPTVVRGNASEIRALAGLADSGGKGVDAADTVESAAEAADELARRLGCVVAVTGAIDRVTDGRRIATVANGHAMMTRVTALGCSLTALTGACLAVEADPFVAAVHALALVGVAGEQAVEAAAGPGSLRVGYLDRLYGLAPEELDRAARIAEAHR
ncbi:hydroxyethylthiazole kinase [Tistlia consotensis]|uniref:Hydroxyethylthiazole kinase n=1 Tax=Tistlia consotensis USBA 355 TaxID=560819 RepID=A0A1Y6B2K3_9PROT|nr:hydroxyethylthiazole kinase [Tistlia consotensis]SME88250.1 hydroxyethylthiazole kinase [Tistlia consotensis USBA 355]SNR24706.1 hydroxyethylthiazole kinase [Tistlia consotensis]